MTNIAISIHDVSKMYRIYEQPQDRLKQMLWRGRRQYGHEFWALRGISIDIERGETVGVIGRNGSGKSTLLQIITGTLAPTTGSVQAHGQIAALLELGSGFNPEFTGRENVFLNGAILGFTREQIAQRFDEIAAFADIGEFIDQPVKLYSSGMLVRLAFAVQACVEPDILIVDEALAVGDVFFQQKCYRRIEELRSRGTTVLLVSHNLSDIRQFCRRAFMLESGEIVSAGASSDVVAHYMLRQQNRQPAAHQEAAAQAAHEEQAPAAETLGWPSNPGAFYSLSEAQQVSNGGARCTAVGLTNRDLEPCRIFLPGETAKIFYEFEIAEDMSIPIGGFNIENDKGILVHGKNGLQYDRPSHAITHVRKGTRLRFCHEIVLDLNLGEYTFEIGLATIDAQSYEQRAWVSAPDLYDRVTRICHINPAGNFAIMSPPLGDAIQLAHFGIANLSGEYTVELC